MQRFLSLWLVAALTSAHSPLFAEDALDEIIVRADFRERSLTDVPFSVTVLDAEMLDARSIQHFEELINSVPNMNWSGDGHRARYFQIRGVGELEQYQGAPNPSIGFVVDDIDFSGIGTIATLFDMESVEVLRGPQGSRYGANALGGLVYIRSTAPGADRDGRIKLAIGDDNMRALGIAFGGVVNSDGSLAYRLSAQKHSSDGFRDNPYLGRSDTNGRDETTLRGRLNFEISEAASMDLTLLYANVDNGYDAFALDNGLTMLSDKPGRDAQESIGAALRFDWTAFGKYSAASISSFADSNIDFSFDADWGNDESWAPVTYDYVSLNDRSRRTLSQEFRIGTDDWLIGLYALKLNDDIVTTNIGTYYDPFYDWADGVNDRLGSDYESLNVAAFGQIDFDMTSTMTLSTGLRVERRTTDYVDTSGMSASPSESMWGGELSLRKTLSERVSTYASLSKGFKAGGFNVGLTPPGKEEFGTEDMLTLELGLKSLLLDGRLRVDAAVFAYRRHDQQARTSEQLDPGDPASFVIYTDNVGKGEALGGEVDLRWTVNDEWEVAATLGLLDAEFQNGREVAHAPPYTASLSLAYRHPQGFFASIDSMSRDAFYFDVSHDQRSQPFELLNTRIGFESERWLLSAWANNLFDRRYAVRGFYFGNEPPDFPPTLYTRPGDPRQIGVTIETRF